MTINSIAIISNVRMLLIFLLINKINIDNVLFLVDESCSRYIRTKRSIVLKKTNGRLSLLVNSIIYNITFRYLSYKLNINNNIIVYGADHITGAKFFLRKYNFILIEDGTLNYLPSSYIRSFKNKILSIPAYGMYKNVSKIYLTKNENIPECIKHKVEIIDIQREWNKKTDDEKREILELLNVNNNNIEKLNDKPYILYTQPLSEDNILSENEKIELYRTILDNYDISKLVIKPHPREKTDYSQIFKDAYIFKDNIPSEILPLLNIEFEKAITLFSTAVLQHKRESVVCYGTRIHPKLYQHFGDIQL